MSKQRIILLDFETGGLDCEENPITEVALVVLDSFTFKELDRFETYVKPYNNLKIGQKALEVTGIKLSDINKGMDIKSVVSAIIILCQKHTPKGDKGRNRPIIAGHKISFDINFMKYAFKFVGKKMEDYWSSDGEEIDRLDTLVMSRHTWKEESEESSFSLKACLKRIGESISGAHKAINDVKANIKLLQFLLTGMRGVEKTSKKSVKGENSVLSEEGEENRKGFQM